MGNSVFFAALLLFLSPASACTKQARDGFRAWKMKNPVTTYDDVIYTETSTKLCQYCNCFLSWPKENSWLNEIDPRAKECPDSLAVCNKRGLFGRTVEYPCCANQVGVPKGQH